MPIARNYKPGSIIYFGGDKTANEIFILQKGKVILKSTSLDTGEEVRESIANGEFFGVKSVLGKYPREDTAQVTAPSIALVLNSDEFEKMVMGNLRILMKMLKVFSNQLRRIGKTVRELIHHGEPKMPATELYYIGEYYAQKGQAEQAKYVYNRYIEVYPDGQYASQAKEKLGAIDSGEITAPEEPSTGLEAPSAETPPPPPEEESLETMLGAPGEEPEKPAEEEKPDVLKTPGGIDITKKFYEALSMFSQEKYEEAIEIHKSITSIQKYKDAEIEKIGQKSMFEMGRCLMELGNHMEAIATFSNLIKRFPLTELLKDALFNIGETYERMEKFDKAINFYQKVVNTPPRQEINKKAKEKLEEVQKKI